MTTIAAVSCVCSCALFCASVKQLSAMGYEKLFHVSWFLFDRLGLVAIHLSFFAAFGHRVKLHSACAML